MSVADEIKKLAELRAGGVLTEEEFQQQKAAALGAPPVSRPKDEKKGGGTFPVIAVVVLLLLVIGLVMGVTADDGPGSEIYDSAAIDACWQEYERKSLSPEEKRVIAGACEMLEDKFKKTHGRPY